MRRENELALWGAEIKQKNQRKRYKQGNIVSDNLAKARLYKLLTLLIYFHAINEWWWWWWWLFNEYFASVGVTDNGCLPRIHHNADVNCSLNNIMFTTDNVKAAINKLKPNLSSGPDGLGYLPYCSSGYAVFLPNLFFSLSTNYFLSLMSPLNGSKLLLSLYTRKA